MCTQRDREMSQEMSQKNVPAPPEGARIETSDQGFGTLTPPLPNVTHRHKNGGV